MTDFKKILQELEEQSDATGASPLQIMFIGLLEALEAKGVDPAEAGSAMISSGVVVFGEHCEKKDFDLLISTMEVFRDVKFKGQSVH